MDSETCSAKLQDLNEDCLRHMFQYLHFEDKVRFYEVCSKWIQVSPGFWRISQFGVINLEKIKSDEWPDLMPNRKLNFVEFREIILSCGPTFQKFIIWLSDYPMEMAYSFDGTAFRTDGEFSYEATLDILVKACCDLKKLEIHTHGGHPFLSEEFHALFLANEKLAEVHLDAGYNSDLYDIVRLNYVPGPARIFHLNCRVLDFMGVYKNAEFICELLESRKVNLKQLTFHFSDSVHDTRLLQVVADYAKELQVLKILSNMPVHNLNLEKLSALKDLEELKIRFRYTKMTNEAISAIADGCKKLKKLEVDGAEIDDTGINTLITSLPELVSVSLKNLYITSILQTNAQFRSNLQRLEINCCQRIPAEELEKISVFTNLDELRIEESNSSNGYIITNEVLTAITVGCRKLRKVILYGCRKITNEGINTIMTTLPNLELVVLE